MRNEMCKAHNLISKLGNEKTRKKIVDLATDCYRELYKGERTNMPDIKYEHNNEETVSTIMEKEVAGYDIFATYRIPVRGEDT